MTPLGPCVEVTGDSELPRPALLRPEPVLGPGNQPRMRLQWSCAPYGVERFEIWIARNAGRPVQAFAGSGLSEQVSVDGPLVLTGAGNRDFGVYQTALAAGLDATEQGTLFSAELPVASNETYFIAVRAVGPGEFNGRAAGEFSNLERFTYIAAEANPQINVPWIPRDLPTATPATDFHPDIEARYLTSLASGVPAWRGVGIRIGELEYRDEPKVGNAGPTSAMPAYSLPGHFDPEEYLLERLVSGDAPASRLWPLVLYRIQVPSTARPLISYDTAQVSPLMESIAHEHTNISGINTTVIHDPFVAVVIKPLPPAQGNNYDVLLLDRNPIIKGASYAYLLVRFGPDHEIADVLLTNTVTIPE
jgi:hypothetical protein